MQPGTMSRLAPASSFRGIGVLEFFDINKFNLSLNKWQSGWLQLVQYVLKANCIVQSTTYLSWQHSHSDLGQIFIMNCIMCQPLCQANLRLRFSCCTYFLHYIHYIILSKLKKASKTLLSSYFCIIYEEELQNVQNCIFSGLTLVFNYKLL